MYLMNVGLNQWTGAGAPLITDVRATGLDQVTLGFINIGAAQLTAANLRIWLALDFLGA